MHPVTCFVAFQVGLLRARPGLLEILDIDLANEIERIFRARAKQIRREMDLERAERMLRACRGAVLALIDEHLAGAVPQSAPHAIPIAAVAS